MTNNAEPHYGNGKICYLELPSRDIQESSSFYQAVFDWRVRTRGDGSIAFDDGVGEVSGTWRSRSQTDQQKWACSCISW